LKAIRSANWECPLSIPTRSLGKCLALAAAALCLGSCSAPRVETARPDPTLARWYSDTLNQLRSTIQQAGTLLEAKKPDEAAALIAKAQPLAARLLSVPRPTIAAAEADSDLDRMYASMLLANRHYGWARMFYQKDEARWRHWNPQTDETARRRKLAETGMAECDRHIESPR